MHTPRTKSISTKVTEEEYAQFEALAGAQTISEWAREVLLRASKPSPSDQSIANREPLTSEDMQDMINRADASKLAKALDRLTTATTEPQAG